jgi:Ulp1 family protease
MAAAYISTDTNFPKQTNTYDCGIFSMLFASYSIEGTLFEASAILCKKLSKNCFVVSLD